MRIVIDMQGAQTDSRFRGIGRYTIELTKGLLRNRKGHEILLTLSSFLPETIDLIRAEFRDLLPPSNIRIWYALGPVAVINHENQKRIQIAEHIYEDFILSLKPDVLLACSLFEGLSDDYIFNSQKISQYCLTSAIQYDLIPYMRPEKYLPTYEHKLWYEKCLQKSLNMDQIFTISEYTKHEYIQAFPQTGKKVINISTDTTKAFYQDKSLKEEKIKFLSMHNITREFILYAGGSEPRKNISALIKAYSMQPQAIREIHQLVIVCGDNARQVELKNKAIQCDLKENDFVVLGYISDENLRLLYSHCKLFIFPSLSEGFGLPVLEAMRCGASVIGSNTTSIPEVIGNTEALFNPYDIQSIAEKLKQCLCDDSFRNQLRMMELEQQKKFSWDLSAQRCINALEEIVQNKTSLKKRPHLLSASNLCTDLALLLEKSEEYYNIAHVLGRTFEQNESGKKQLFVDISELYQRDSKTGIQRVTRSVLKELLHTPPTGYLVRPVFARSFKESGYFYAMEFAQNLCGVGSENLNSELDNQPIDFNHNDFFLGLDFQASIVPLQSSFLQTMHRHGVKIFFVVYDLLPLHFPQYCDVGVPECYQVWLNTLMLFDGITCISHAVATDMRNWIKDNYPKHDKFSPSVSWFHIGSSIEDSVPTKGLPEDASLILATMRRTPTILMVSTIEPRKKYDQALAAMDILWAKGTEINLVIVGKAGWKTEQFIELLKKHPRQGTNLFWLCGISDEYLEKVYKAATVVLMASIGEGFGLPVVEGALHGKPLILRDLPVFREIAGDHAFYFNGEKPEDLATAIEKWLKLYKEGKAPSSEGVETLTWKESTQMLLKQLPL